MTSEAVPSYRRFLIQHDPTIGYRFIPDLYARIGEPGTSFVIETNSLGFRTPQSTMGTDPSGPRVLALGDSYLAGDGVSNHERFVDIVGHKMGLNVFNAGLPGSGTDQQLLIQEQLGDSFPYDLLVFAPFCHNISRNLRPDLFFLDWGTGQRLAVRKPFFTIDKESGSLRLDNSPVPLSDSLYSDVERTLKTQVTAGFRRTMPCVGWLLRAARENGYRMAYRSGLLRADKFFADPEGYSWRLMRALYLRMAQNAAGRPIVIIPIPLHHHVTHNARPFYLERWREVADSNAQVVDILPELRKLDKRGRRNLYLADGHFSSAGHARVAELCHSAIAGPLERRLRGQRSTQQAPPTGPPSLRGGERRILGISCFYHDSAAALIADGRVLAAAQEERFTRVKHDRRFPTNAIQYCLEEGRIEIDDLDAVVYYDNEAMTLERVLSTSLFLGRKGCRAWSRNVSELLRTKLSIEGRIRSELNFGGKVYRGVHHRSHAASAFYQSPFQEAAIVTIDGVGEWATTTIARGEGNRIDLLKEQRFPHSLGLLYSAFTSFCGFKVNSGEYKLMGLGPYGTPRFQHDILKSLLDLRDDGSFVLNLDYFGFLEGERMTSGRFADLFNGPARSPETPITKRECDIASSIQRVTEEIVLRMVRHASDLTSSENLTLAGGVALNCVANGRVLREGPFEHIWIQPAAGDAGGALGAALDVWHGTWSEPRADVNSKSRSNDSCFGPAFSQAEVEAYLSFHRYPYEALSDKHLIDRVALELSEGKIVGHFHGRMEFGPRALGNRSILGDPRNSSTQKDMNLKIKYRESFRPFAPVVMEEHMSEFFGIDAESPYMLLVAPVADRVRRRVPHVESEDLLDRVQQARSEIPAVTHVDYSARIQSVGRRRFPRLHRILEAFRQRTGCPVLVNTSFNVRGEPIVCTPADAYRCFMRTELDVLVMENCVLKKPQQPEWKEKGDWTREFDLD